MNSLAQLALARSNAWTPESRSVLRRYPLGPTDLAVFCAGSSREQLPEIGNCMHSIWSEAALKRVGGCVLHGTCGPLPASSSPDDTRYWLVEQANMTSWRCFERDFPQAEGGLFTAKMRSGVPSPQSRIRCVLKASNADPSLGTIAGTLLAKFERYQPRE